MIPRIPTITLIAILVAQPGLAQQIGTEAAEPTDAIARQLPISTLTCRELLQASGQNRDLLLALFHGYVAGKSGAQALDTVDMSFVTDAVVDHCIDKPSDPLLAAFAAVDTDER